MNDSLRTDVFVRYPPETIAVACIYLSARKLKEPLPKNPSWFNVLGVEEDDIKDCCYRLVLFFIYERIRLPCTQGHLTQIFPTFPNNIVNLDFYMKTDLELSWVSNNR